MGYYMGIDLGGTNIVAGVVDEHYNIVKKTSAPTKSTRSFEEIIAEMALLAKAATLEAGLSEKDISYVGIGVPGTVNPETREVVWANNLGWLNRDVAGEFCKTWNIDVKVANDADCAALGEVMAGAAKDYDNAILITLGTGIGSGMVNNRKLYFGGNGFSTEMGHSTIVYNGFPCTCGRKGCFEAYGSVTALIRQTLEYMILYPHSLMWAECGNDLDRVNGRTAFEAAKKGDEGGQIVVDQYIGYLAAGLTSLEAAFRPRAFILGGGVSNEGENLLVPLRKKVKETMLSADVLTPPAILKAELGNDAGVIGAALLGI